MYSSRHCSHTVSSSQIPPPWWTRLCCVCIRHACMYGATISHCNNQRSWRNVHTFVFRSNKPSPRKNLIPSRVAKLRYRNEYSTGRSSCQWAPISNLLSTYLMVKAGMLIARMDIVRSFIWDTLLVYVFKINRQRCHGPCCIPRTTRKPTKVAC